MGPLYTIKPMRLAFMQVFLVAFYWLAGCGIQQASSQSSDGTNLRTAFPSYCSIQAAVHSMGLRYTMPCRVVCCVTYGQQIDFIVKSPLGGVLMRGLIGKKSVTVVDPLRRIVYEWNYNHIKQYYDFPCNYPFIQSLLLGTAYKPMDDQVSVPDPLPSDVIYTYDERTRKVISVQLIDTKQGSAFKVLYRYKLVKNKTFLSGLTIHWTLRHKGALYQIRVVLHKLRFKALKKPNIRLKVPIYYRKAVTWPCH